MRVTAIRISGFRSLEATDQIDLGSINVLIGANNAGKSSILRALYLLQQGSGTAFADVRTASGKALIEISVADVIGVAAMGAAGNVGAGTFSLGYETLDRRGGQQSFNFCDAAGSNHSFAQLPAVDPNHFIVPYLSKRKTLSYNEDVRSQHALNIQPSFQFLAAKLSRICNPSFPGSNQYMSACREILGFEITAIPSEGGQVPGVYLPSKEPLPIDQMGEGVPHIAGLLADLALSENKLFLIEEPENDLHPDALRALLRLLVTSSTKNQFVISTHSNIVLQHLGAEPSCSVYEVSAEKGQLPVTAKVRLVDRTPEARLTVLKAMGYSLSDFDLWDGWLFVEESSAERIIRDYLVPWFAPRLTRVRTISSGGTSKVEPSSVRFI